AVGKVRIVQFGTEKQARTVVLPALDWLKRSERAPSRRDGLQPVIEASTSRCCSCSKSAARTPALAATFIDAAQDVRTRRGRTARTPDSPVLSGRDQASPIPSSRFLNSLTAADAARQYNETVAIAGSLGRIFRIGGSRVSTTTQYSTGAGENVICYWEQRCG
ncbi:MAG: hypothetical protein WB586_09555, partial [Chthoniobacterales bacterium]